MRRGLIGYPLGHSYSKLIHEQITDYTYDLIEIQPDELDQFMKERQFDALNVTIPYKEKVIPYLDEIDEKAKRIGAVNTIVKNAGICKGYNTDYYGFKWLLENNHIEIENKKVVILGNGGATKAVFIVCDDLKAKEIRITSRKKSAHTITYDELIEEHCDVQVIINATPVGMYPHHDEVPIDLSKFHQLESVVDIICNPMMTQLLLDAKEKGLQTAGGLGMLVAQAKQAIEIFLDKHVNDDVINQLVGQIERLKENIVLIGMPSSGKSTLAKSLGEKLNKKVIDLDEIIVQNARESIPSLFEKYGEEYFRKCESDAVLSCCMEEGIIISCGGGVVKKKENIAHLKKKGVLVWVKRDFEYCVVDDSRPLSPTKDKIVKLYNERKDLYQKAADMIVENNTTVETCVNQIIQKIESRK